VPPFAACQTPVRQKRYNEENPSAGDPIMSRIFLTIMPRLLLLAVLFSASAHALEAVNGSTALVTFKKIPENAVLLYGEKPIPLLEHPLYHKKKIALVPVGYRTEPGEKELNVRWGKKSKTLSLLVKKGEYLSEAIRVAPSKVTPNKKQARRTKREYKAAMQVYRRFTPRRYWKKPFVLPIKSSITSPFGTARTYNGSLKGFHSGTDFKADVGTPVRASNDGIVVIAQARYYAGNSVVIDHGEGLYSCYYHLSKMAVKVGERVVRNEEIGLSGKSGRVTGPHLHFAFMLHGVQVDPLQLIRTVNALYEGRPSGERLATRD
jgi:murein DD-endopeptidase MepM/ murein hydrolase activator NlpD